MKNNKQSIKQALKTHYENKSLSQEQLGKLEQKVKFKYPKKMNKTLIKLNKFIKYTSSIAAAFFIFSVVLNIYQTPKVITSAYTDIYKDMNLNNGMQISMLQWLAENRIATVPMEFPIKMSKFCRLDQVLTLHLRIAGKKQGEMNVFLHQGASSFFWRDRSGKVDNMNWKLIQVRDNLTLVVLYTHDMREASVDFILEKMMNKFEV